MIIITIIIIFFSKNVPLFYFYSFEFACLCECCMSQPKTVSTYILCVNLKVRRQLDSNERD